MIKKENVTFQAKLKEIYKSHDKIAPLIEDLHEIPQQSIEDYFINLQIIVKEDLDKKIGDYEGISGEKRGIEPESIFSKPPNEEKKPTSKVLVLGGAGVGKTTLMQYMAYQWSIGKLWKDKFDYVYRITLKTLLNSEWKQTPWPYDEKDRRESLLKCLIHYNLTKNLKTMSERELLRPQNIPWGKNERILLLLDGYDEIAHLQDDDPDYRILFEEIFQQGKLILTSRPNAINNSMKEKFDLIIENTGLNDSGVDQYFKQYFRNNAEKGKELARFLAGNPIIRGICKIPVNIAMICYIWSEAESNEKLSEISNLSSLYSQVIDHLANRFFVHNKWRGARVEGTNLGEKLSAGSLNLDELKVLAHAAYKGLTGGGINIANKDRVETLIIRGVQDKGGKKDLKDEDGISLQSSINYLSRQKIIQKEKVDLRSIYKFGLLKTEGAITAGTASSTMIENERSETNLQNQYYSFIHLTFQEYLTAYYLKELLYNGSSQERNDVCQYLAEHRYESRYLMTLKFMTGLVSAEQERKRDEVATLFWDAIVCNVDGVIELGIETKVNLLMHILGQAKIKGELDTKIPNIDDIIRLIDFVVLSDFLNWFPQLKKNDYISDNIKEGILKAIFEDSLEWHIGKAAEILNSFSSPTLKSAIDLTSYKPDGEIEIAPKSGRIFNTGLLMAMDFAAKFSHEESRNLLRKLMDMVANYDSKSSPEILKVAHAAIWTVAELVSKVKVSLEDNLELIEGLNKAYKIMEESSKDRCIYAMTVVIESIEEKKSKVLLFNHLHQALNFSLGEKFMIELIPKIKDKDTAAQALASLTNKDSEHCDLSAITKIFPEVEDKDTLLKALEQVMRQFNGVIRSRNHLDERLFALNVASSLAKALGDEQMLGKVLEQALGMLSWADKTDFFKYHDLEHGEFHFNNMLSSILAVIVGLVKAVGDKNTLSKALEQVTCYAAEPKQESRKLAITAIVELAKAIGDKKVFVKTLNQAAKFFERCRRGCTDRDCKHWKLDAGQDAANDLYRLIELVEINETPEKAIEQVISLLASTCLDLRRAATKKIVDITKRTEDKSLHAKCFEQLNIVITGTSKELSHREHALVTMSELVTIVGDKATLAKSLGKIMSIVASKKENSELRICALKTTIELAQAVDDKERISQAFEHLSHILTSLGANVKESHLKCTIESAVIVIKAVGDKEKVWKAFEILKMMFSCEGRFDILNAAMTAMIELANTATNKDIAAQALEQIFEVFASSDKYVSYGSSEFDSLIEHAKRIEDKETLAKILELVIDNFNNLSADSAFYTTFKRSIFDVMMDIAKKLGYKKPLTKALAQPANFLAHSRYGVRKKATKAMSELVKAIGDEDTFHEIFDHVSNLLAQCLAEPEKSDNFQEKMACLQEQLAELAIATKDNEILDKAFKQIASLQDNDNLVNVKAAYRIAFAGKNKGNALAMMKWNLDKDGDLAIEHIPAAALFLDTEILLRGLTHSDESISSQTYFGVLHLLRDDDMRDLGCLKPYEAIKPALVAIDYKGEYLANEGNNFLDRRITDLDGEGMQWIYDNYDVLAKLSKENKPFMRSLYHKLMQDSKINIVLKEKLMMKLINYGLDTSLTRTGEIIIEGRNYTIHSKDTELLLERIAKAVIDQEKDILAFQYKNNQAIFPKSVTNGLKKAAIDVEMVYSVVDKSRALSCHGWLLTLLKGEGGQQIVLLEQRSIFGDHLLYDLSNQKLLRVHPVDLNKKLNEIFGAYSVAQKYQGVSTVMNTSEGNEIINGTKVFNPSLIVFEQSKEYFQQELLGLGNTDRLDFISSVLGSKLNDYQKLISINLNSQPNVSSEDKIKIKEYYKAFSGTFAMVYETSQIINSGMIKLDSGDITTMVLSTIVSFAPFVGEKLSEAVTSLGEFINAKKMKQDARKMTSLSADVVGLNQFVGELAFNIILVPNKQQQIINMTNEYFQTISGNLIEKAKKFFSNLDEKLDVYLYGQQYKTPAAKLGHKDANTLIEHWVKAFVNHANITQEFKELALANIEVIPKLPSSSQIGGLQQKPLNKNKGPGASDRNRYYECLTKVLDFIACKTCRNIVSAYHQRSHPAVAPLEEAPMIANVSHMKESDSSLMALNNSSNISKRVLTE